MMNENKMVAQDEILNRAKMLTERALDRSRSEDERADYTQEALQLLSRLATD